MNFMFTEPFSGWRKVRVRERKTAVDWAQEIKDLLDTEYREAEPVVLVCDNFNTHTPAAFYKAFSLVEARRLAKRLETHYTPKHGSWLNIAEIKLSVLSNQCLPVCVQVFRTGRKESIPDIESLKEHFCLDEQSQQQEQGCPLAVHDRRCSHQTEKAVSRLRRALVIKG